MEKYLFVCHQNRQRSPFAEQWLSKKFREKGIQSYVKSAGISVPDKGIQLTQELVDWADRIFFMEEYMVERIKGKYERLEGKIEVLNIPCNFDIEIEDNTEIKRMNAREALEYFYKDPTHIDIGGDLMDKLLEAKLKYLFE